MLCIKSIRKTQDFKWVKFHIPLHIYVALKNAFQRTLVFLGISDYVSHYTVYALKENGLNFFQFIKV